MSDLHLSQPPVARAQMLIRRPAADVFASFVDPAITSHFWFSRGSGALTPGTRVRWDWEDYGASAEVTVKAIEPNRRILIEWDSYGTTEVEWTFEPRNDHATFVTVTNRGFNAPGDEAVANALDSAGGFAFLLAGAKAWLEHGLALDLVRDHAPDHHVPNDASG